MPGTTLGHPAPTVSGLTFTVFSYLPLLDCLMMSPKKSFSLLGHPHQVKQGRPHLTSSLEA